jgi:hypothetical protein
VADRAVFNRRYTRSIRATSTSLLRRGTLVGLLAGSGRGVGGALDDVGDGVGCGAVRQPQTVEHYLSNVYRKRGLRSRSELAKAMATNLTTA